MVKEYPITTLCEDIMRELENIKLSTYALRNYKKEGIDPILAEYGSASKIFYDKEFTNHIVALFEKRYIDGETSSAKKNKVRKIASVLDEYVTDGIFRWHVLKKPILIKLSEPYEETLQFFKASEEKKKLYREETILGQINAIRDFLHYLETRNCYEFSELSMSIVSEYLNQKAKNYAGGFSLVLRSLRKFNYFLLNQDNISCIDFNGALLARESRRKKLYPAFTQDEIDKIMSVIPVKTRIGARDFAMFNIARTTGIRAIDIANLSRTSIHWETSEIRVLQHKTQVEVILPLNPSAAIATIEYITKWRPDTDSDALFVRDKAPFIGLTTGGIGNRLKYYMELANIEYIPGCKKGLHSFRRFVASEMLNHGASFDEVKEILGQTDINSVKPYARISQENLKYCTLPLNGYECLQEDLL